MAARVGNALVFDLTGGTLNDQDDILENLEAIPAEDYQILLTAAVSWVDPSSESLWWMVNVDLSLEAYDAQDNQLEWDSGVHTGISLGYQSVPNTNRQQGMVMQSVVNVPSGVVMMKARKGATVYSEPPGTTGSVNLDFCRVSFVIVTMV